jgi:hypothetical protein
MNQVEFILKRSEEIFLRALGDLYCGMLQQGFYSGLRIEKESEQT